MTLNDWFDRALSRLPNSKRSIYIALLLATVGAVALMAASGGRPAQYETATVTKGPMTLEVSASGTAEPPSTIELRFKASGRLVSRTARAGSKVAAGQVLARQDTAQTDSQIAQMRASLDLQKARLAQLLAGATEEDIAVSLSAVESARSSLESARRNVLTILRDTYLKADDAVHAQADTMFTNPRQSNAQLTFTTPNTQVENDVLGLRAQLETELAAWNTDSQSLSATSDLDAALQRTDQRLSLVADFLDKLASIINGQAFGRNGTLNQATLDGYRAAVSAARTSVSLASSNSTGAANSLATATSAVKSAQGQLELKTARPRDVDIAVYQTQIQQAEASLLQTQIQRADALVVAPVKGTVTGYDGEIGETVGPDRAVITMIPDGALQITVNISETKIANVQLGQIARITLDAFPGRQFEGKVTEINPAQTNIGGAVYYKSKVVFTNNDGDVRPGMTANLWINVVSKPQALHVPVTAVVSKSDGKFVNVLVDRKLEERRVETGITDSAGNIEIVSGLSSGDTVVIQKAR